MSHHKLVLLLVMCAGIFGVAGGCNCGEPTNTEEDAGGGDGLDAGEDAGGGGGGGAGGGQGFNDGGCGVLGTICSSGDACCSGFCGSGGLCSVQGGFCAGAGADCSSSIDCCSNQCVGGKCAATQCTSTGAACTSNDQCCTRSCGVPAPIALPDGGTDDAGSTAECLPPPGQNLSVGVLGDGCDAGSQCASLLCKDLACAPAGPCQANNDVCGTSSQCCGNICTVNDGGAGFCEFITGGGAGACKQDFNPCTSRTECCSRTCVDIGSGQAVCAPATGCRVTGDFCSSTASCCGGAPGNPNFTVACDPQTQRCNQGQSCVSPGQICGNPKLLDGGVVRTADGGVYSGGTAAVACCTGGTPPTDPNGNLCHLDSTGVPRCYTNPSTTCPYGINGTAGCCIAAGDSCQFKDQCCNGSPCVPNSDGGTGFVCAGQTTCFGLGAACSPGSTDGGECCAGSVCGVAGELGGYACQRPSDAGTADGGGCLQNGTSCTSSDRCCSSVCKANDAGTNVCQLIICQAQGLACTASADCCSGLNCEFQPGQTVGTCQQALCAQAGQTCSAGGGNACCVGLTCSDSQTGAACGSTGTCLCTSPLQ